MEETDETGLEMLTGEIVNKDRIWSRIKQNLPLRENQLKARDYGSFTLLLHRPFVRYAAVACIIFIAFFGGRYSTGTVNASPVPEDPTADHLFIFGYKDAVGNLPGNNFKIKFDGSLRLYNNSVAPKRINVGDTSFMLTPRKSHYLIGNSQNPELIVEDRYKISSQKPPSLEGYFSIQKQ